MMCSASALVRGGMVKWRPAAATPLLHARGMADGGQDLGKQTSLVKSERANPLDSPDFFGVGGLFTVADLFRARVHLVSHDKMLEMPCRSSLQRCLFFPGPHLSRS